MPKSSKQIPGSASCTSDLDQDLRPIFIRGAAGSAASMTLELGQSGAATSGAEG